MNGREMFRQMATDKQTSKHKLGKMVESAGRRSLPKMQKAVKAATVTTLKTTSIKKRLNIQPANLARS